MLRPIVLKSVFILALFATTVHGGPFANPGVIESEMRIWANKVVEFVPTPTGSDASLAPHALGRPDNELVSLGDLDESTLTAEPGSITVSLPYPFRNGDGWDFAVFENAGLFFDEPFIFAELAEVEVSSNGIDFLRFPSIARNVEPGLGTADTEITADFGRDFAGINTTNTLHLAGIHPSGLGTSFDLEALLPLLETLDIDLDINAIRYVRLIDVPGNGTFLDSEGHPILDPWPSTGDTGGFDLDAVGARYPVPEPHCHTMVGFVAILGFAVVRRRRAQDRKCVQSMDMEL